MKNSVMLLVGFCIETRALYCYMYALVTYYAWGNRLCLHQMSCPDAGTSEMKN